jgi:hypothetical protein
MAPQTTSTFGVQTKVDQALILHEAILLGLIGNPEVIDTQMVGIPSDRSFLTMASGSLLKKRYGRALIETGMDKLQCGPIISHRCVQ